MKKVHFILLLLIFGCASSQRLQQPRDIFASLEEIRSTAARTGTVPIDKISQPRGKTGFYYLLDKDGVVLYHPVGYVRGSNMSGIPMVKEILIKEKGFGTYESGGIKRTVFFIEMPDGSRLCYSIDPDEVGGN
jgi:hypothetical protein